MPDRAHARAVVSYYRAMLGRGIKPALAEPVHPLLVLHGADDRCMEPGLARLAGAATADRRRRALPPARAAGGGGASAIVSFLA